MAAHCTSGAPNIDGQVHIVGNRLAAVITGALGHAVKRLRRTFKSRAEAKYRLFATVSMAPPNLAESAVCSIPGSVHGESKHRGRWLKIDQNDSQVIPFEDSTLLPINDAHPAS
jgi:hypothetical protein